MRCEFAVQLNRAGAEIWAVPVPEPVWTSEDLAAWTAPRVQYSRAPRVVRGRALTSGRYASSAFVAPRRLPLKPLARFAVTVAGVEREPMESTELMIKPSMTSCLTSWPPRPPHRVVPRRKRRSSSQGDKRARGLSSISNALTHNVGFSFVISMIRRY